MPAKKKAKPKGKKPVRRAKASMGKSWSTDEIKKLRVAYKAKSASAIAKEMRRSLASVRGKISALNLKKGRVRKAKSKVAKRGRR